MSRNVKKISDSWDLGMLTTEETGELAGVVFGVSDGCRPTCEAFCQQLSDEHLTELSVAVEAACKERGL